jgi:hypothetical protein
MGFSMVLLVESVGAYPVEIPDEGTIGDTRGYVDVTPIIDNRQAPAWGVPGMGDRLMPHDEVLGAPCGATGVTRREKERNLRA